MWLYSLRLCNVQQHKYGVGVAVAVAATGLVHIAGGTHIVVASVTGDLLAAFVQPATYKCIMCIWFRFWIYSCR